MKDAPVQLAILRALAEKPLSLRAILAECQGIPEESIKSALQRLRKAGRIVKTGGSVVGGSSIYALLNSHCPTCGRPHQSPEIH